QGEGGGQMLRTSLTLSALRGVPFEMEKIRAKRERPGLKRQHLTCVQAVAEICGAKTEGAEVGSLSLSFIPGSIRGGEYRFDIDTAGSVTLVAQTVIPVLLRADAPSRVTITGGTNVPFAPIWEFFERTYLPQVRAMGASVEASLVRYGFYPAAGGEICLDIQPICKPCAYKFSELGAYLDGKVVGLVANLKRGIAETEIEIVAASFPELALQGEVLTVESSGPGNCCYAQLDYEKGSVIFSEVGTFGKSRKAVAHTVVSQVRKFLSAGGAVEEHLSDQLLTPLYACTRDTGYAGEYVTGAASAHLVTNIDVIRQFDVDWKIESRKLEQRNATEYRCGEKLSE
ncbi:MAG: RNA 3'-phosphate cyclase, partial [Kiritimatiellae bacterium]|nr:RNA 3'-phosphate cyclase [Kiritimatiellia bacterium]